jgi:hypothetical protein
LGNAVGNAAATMDVGNTAKSAVSITSRYIGYKV